MRLGGARSWHAVTQPRGLDQVVEEQATTVIGWNQVPSLVDNAEAVRVPSGRRPGGPPSPDILALASPSNSSEGLGRMAAKSTSRVS